MAEGIEVVMVGGVMDGFNSDPGGDVGVGRMQVEVVG